MAEESERMKTEFERLKAENSQLRTTQESRSGWTPTLGVNGLKNLIG